MKMIVGLGNMGEQYEKTRHNVGFMFLDYIRERMDLSEFAAKNEMKAFVIKQGDMILVKPTTMMNLSGLTARTIMNFYHVDKNDLIVVHDDLDIVFGDWKCQMGKGPKVHNGVNNIEELIGTKDFWRIRVGVDGRDESMRKKVIPNEYVLADFSDTEQKKLATVFEEMFDYLESEWL